jgi:hypothetical protein
MHPRLPVLALTVPLLPPLLQDHVPEDVEGQLLALMDRARASLQAQQAAAKERSGVGQREGGGGTRYNGLGLITYNAALNSFVELG